MRRARPGLGIGMVLGALAALAPGALGVGEFADVHLRDGRHFFGKILEESDEKLVIEYYFGSIVSELSFSMIEVMRIDRRERTEDEPDDDARDELEDLRDRDDEAVEERSRAGFAIVPVSGVFGEEITAGFFEAAMREAERSGAEAVVFHIDSPGGYIHELESIRRTLDEHPEAVVAFYVDDEAFSAAALLCLSAEHFYIGEGARLGAAVGFSVNETGAAEVDAKFNAAFAATWRAYAERVGRSPYLVDAMIEMERELWADTRGEPWTLYGERPFEPERGQEDPFVLLDDKKHVLALSHTEANAVGAVDGIVLRPGSVPRMLGLADASSEAFDGERFSKRYFRAYRNNMEKTRRAVRDITEAANLLQTAETRAEARGRLREIMSNCNRVVSLFDRYDYVRNHVRAQGYSKGQFEDTVRLIRRVLGRE